MQTVIYMASSYRCALITFQALNKNTFGLVSVKNLLFQCSLCLLVGCGGSSAPPEPSPSPKNTAAPSSAFGGGSPRASIAPADRSSVTDGFAEQGSRAGNATATSDDNEIPVRSKNVTEWTLEDLASARVDGDEQLLEAVEHYIDKRGDEDEVVEALIAMLAIDPEPDPEPEETQTATGARSPPNAGPYQGYGPASGFGPGLARPGFGRSQTTTPQKHRYVSAEVATSILEGLGKSSCTLATDALKKLVVGKQPAPLSEQEILELTIRSLATKITPEREKLLLGLFMKPDVAQPVKFEEIAGTTGLYGGPRRQDRAMRGNFMGPNLHGPRSGLSRRTTRRGTAQPNTPEWIQEEVLYAAGHHFSQESRVKLAKFLSNPDVVVETAQLTEELLIVDDPRNDPAQILLLLNPFTEQATREQIEDTLIQSCSKSLLELMAIGESDIGAQTGARGRFGFGGPAAGQFPGPGLRTGRGQPPLNNGRPSRRSNRDINATPLGQPQTPTPKTVDPDKRRQQRRGLLWKSNVVSMLHNAMQQRNFEGVDSRLPLLMGTIPITPAREALRKVFSEYERQDPNTLFDMGMFSSTTLDPAALIFGKQLYHQLEPDTGGAAGTNPADTWSQRIDPYVADLCQRFYAAAPTTQSDKDNQAIDKRFPASLHDRGKAVARYDLVWPDNVNKSWKRFKVAPLQLHYIRLKDEGAVDRMVYFYRKNYGDSRETQINNGVWFDGFDPKTQMSIDVRITAQDGNLGVPVGREINAGGRRNVQRGGRGPGGRGERKTVIVEVLTVTIAKKEASS